MITRRIIIFCLFIVLNMVFICKVLANAQDHYSKKGCLSSLITKDENTLIAAASKQMDSTEEEVGWKYFSIETQTPRDADFLIAGVKQLEAIIEDITAEIRKAEFEEDFIDELDLALIELGVNAIKYGVEGQTVHLFYRSSDDFFEIKIVNKIAPGTTFDMEQIPDPRLPENLLKTSGRGVFFNQELATKWGGTLTQPSGVDEVIMHLKVPLANVVQSKATLSNELELNPLPLLHSA